MRVCVLYFGVLKDLVGHGRSEMDLAEGASVAELLEAHRGLGKGQASLWDSIAVAVNQEYARAGDVLKDGDEVALLPPVSGGCKRQQQKRNAGVLRSAQNDKIFAPLRMTKFGREFKRQVQAAMVEDGKVCGLR
jgi:molybdopterin converting factor subunit 1